MSTAYPELQHVTHPYPCQSLTISGRLCGVPANQLCIHCGRPTCGRHEDRHALCPVRVKG